MVEISSNPYLTSDFAFLPCFRILIGLIFISLCSPTRYAHTRAMQTIATSLAMRSISRIWVSSMLKPEDFMALKGRFYLPSFFVCQNRLLGILRLKHMRICNSGTPSEFLIRLLKQDRHTHLCEERAYGRISPDRPSNH